MSSAHKILFLFPFLLALAGCGFHPLYGSRSADPPGVASQMDEIEIGLLPNRDGQLLHQALEADLHRAGAPVFYRYHLDISYGLSAQTAGLQPDTSNSRNRILARAHWRLTPAGNHTKTIAEGNASAMDAVNILDNQLFALSLSNSDVDRQLAHEIAGQISQQIAIYLTTHPKAG